MRDMVLVWYDHHYGLEVLYLKGGVHSDMRCVDAWLDEMGWTDRHCCSPRKAVASYLAILALLTADKPKVFVTQQPHRTGQLRENVSQIRSVDLAFVHVALTTLSITKALSLSPSRAVCIGWSRDCQESFARESLGKARTRSALD